MNNSIVELVILAPLESTYSMSSYIISWVLVTTLCYHYDPAHRRGSWAQVTCLGPCSWEEQSQEESSGLTPEAELFPPASAPAKPQPWQGEPQNVKQSDMVATAEF